MKFTAYGDPVPQGSMKAFVSATTDKAMMQPGNKRALMAWRKTIAWEAKKAMAGQFAFDGPIWVRAAFYLRKPKSVKRGCPDRKPDLDKLLRALFDGMSGVVYSDDARVVTVQAMKLYAAEPRVEVEVEPL